MKKILFAALAGQSQVAHRMKLMVLTMELQKVKMK